MAIELKLIDKLLADYAVLERAMGSEMKKCDRYEKHDPAGDNSGI